MSKKSNVAELPDEARPIVRSYVITELKDLHAAITGYMKLYSAQFSEFERTQLKRVGFEASRLADIIEERR